MQAVYRAIGYFGSELPEVGYDADKGVITNVEGRVVDEKRRARARPVRYRVD